jgi:uridine kinase
MNVRSTFLLGVAGGTGSGKTTVAERLAEVMGPGDVAVMKLDSYYRDRSDLTFDERVTIDYDHPDSFDWPLLLDQIDALLCGRSVQVPIYDFSQHARTPHHELLVPHPIVIVEGILVLWEPSLRQKFDLKVFVDTDADIRFIRRMQRDVAERGRTTDNVIAQYLATVRPGHEGFIEPSKRYADVIIPHGGFNAPATDVLLARIRELV